MATGIAPKLEDQVAEAVHDARHAAEAGRAVHEAERLDPARYVIELAELLLERREDRKRGQASRLVRLLETDIRADLALHQDFGTVERAVAGYVRISAAH